MTLEGKRAVGSPKWRVVNLPTFLSTPNMDKLLKDSMKKMDKAMKELPAECFGSFRNARVTVHSGIVNEATDSNGLSDPYVKVYNEHSGKLLYTTKVHKKTLSPVWEETFDIKIHCGLHVLFKVYDKDMISDDYIGEYKQYLTADAQQDPDIMKAPIRLVDKEVVDICDQGKIGKEKGKLTITIRDMGLCSDAK